MDYSKSIVLIPALNEKDNLRELIPAIFTYLPRVSVLVVDDDSQDGTSELVGQLSQNLNNLFLLERKQDFGYGRASLEGFRWAMSRDYDYLVTMDADFSHDYKAIPAILEKLEQHDVVVGSRYIRMGGVKNWNLFRRLLSKFANLYVRMILGLPVHDVTSGFNGYRTEVLRKIDLSLIRSDGYAFLVELKSRLHKAGNSFIEYPILFSERREGESKMSGKIIWESIKLPWRIR